MDKVKPMVSKVAPSNAIPVVKSLTEVDDPVKGDMVISEDSLGGLVLYIYDGSQFSPVSGGSSPTGSGVIDAGAIGQLDDPSLDSWGSPTEAALIIGSTSNEFSNAPNGINVGEYAGILIKEYSAGASRISYLTETGRQFQRLNTGGGWGSWVETSVSSKESIWTLYNNTLPTVRTSTDLTVFDEVVIDMDLFNSVEQDFQGNLTVDTVDEMAFTPAHANAYEIQIHGTITEPSTSFSSILLVQLFDENTNAPMTGSVQSVAPAWSWSGESYFSFNCVGFGRLNTGSKIRLQLSSNEATSYTLKDCIVILKPLD